MMKNILFLLSSLLVLSCTQSTETNEEQAVSTNRIPVIIDTDANNELDDQHAMAYLFFNNETFETRGVTVNVTNNGGDIKAQTQEAERVMKLCQVFGKIPLKEGATGTFEEIAPNLNNENYDGDEAVEFIIEQVKSSEEQMMLLPVGKLTNIALVLKKAPELKSKVKIVWLGSNYPEKGEYNQENDTSALSYILQQDVPFEIVTVRYGKPSGSDAVRATPDDINGNLTGKGPEVAPVEGRHGGEFTRFGDYSVNLFSKIDLYDDPPSRALFDMVAVAILKNPSWGTATEIPAPKLVNEEWIEQPENTRKVTIWENFNEEAICKDFYETIQNGN